MRKIFAVGAVVVIALVAFPTIAGAQADGPRMPPAVDGWTQKSIPALAAAQATAPAPKRDIAGTWDPGNGGIQALGPRDMPEDGKPEHQLPYTAAGRAKLATTKPSNGVRSVLPGETNDPVVACDPQGFPREDLYELRTMQIIPRPSNITLLFEFGKIWRVAWTDGRKVPDNVDPRWFGYSVGHWADDYTFVVDTTGMTDRTWIDRAGRPHGSDLHVEERYHRVNYGTLELTVTITDPEMYTKPWVAVNKMPFRLLPDNFDVTEMMCSPTQISKYNQLFGFPASNKDQNGR